MPAANSLLGLTALCRHFVAGALSELVPAHNRISPQPETRAKPLCPILCVDATCGNGHDTLFLLSLLRPLPPDRIAGILAFDVQEQALAATQAALDKAYPGLQAEPGQHQAQPDQSAQPDQPVQPDQPPRPDQSVQPDQPARPGHVVPVRLLLRSHAELAAAQDEFAPESALGLVIYNLGFLPRSDKRIITRSESTLASLRAAAQRLCPGGLIALHAYAGHAGGQQETDAVDSWFSALPYLAWTVGRYDQCNKTNNPETLYLARKLPAPGP